MLQTKHLQPSSSARFGNDLGPNLKAYSSSIGFKSQKLTSMHKIQKRTCNPRSTVLFASEYAGAQGLEFKRAESFGSLIAKRDSGVGNDKHPRAAIRYPQSGMVRGHAIHFALIIPS